MQQLRTLLFRHRAVAMLVVFAALCMKVFVPAGYMLGQGSKVLTVQLCADASGEHTAKQIAIPMKGESGKPSEPGKGECAFGSLSMASLAGVDCILLALALAFILALGFVPSRPTSLKHTSHLRPPLRGPPALV